MQELPTEEKEGYTTRAILLMNNQPMVSIVMMMDVFLYNCSYQEGEEGGSSAKQ